MLSIFNRDNWGEIFATIRKNKLRTFLTGFSISWGIFMFCILLCAGNGLRNGMVSNFGSRSVNSIEIWGRRTSIPYEGFPERRPVRMDERDVELIRNRVPEAVDITPMVTTTLNARYETIDADCSFWGVNPEFQRINGIEIVANQGRFLNAVDVRERRKVAVVNERIKEVLFKNEDPVGKMFIAGELGFTVIGVYKEDAWGNDQKAYIPVSTAQMLYSGGRNYNDINFTVEGLDTKEANEAFEADFRNKLSVLHVFDPADKRAIGIWNQLQNYLQFLGIFNGISAFIWIIGVGTLIAGIIGISNIMLITVRERTREIGIRKALGATPSSILGSILLESIFITSVFGYFGMFLGVGMGELVSTILQSPGMEEASQMIKNPTIEVPIALGAMGVLILSGLLAGYFPALKAVKVSPVEAMRAE